MKLLCFLSLIATAQCGFWGSWGSPSAFLGLPKLKDDSLEEPLSKIAERAEAEAWVLYTQQDQGKILHKKNTTESNLSTPSDDFDLPRKSQRRSREAKLISSLAKVGEDGQ